MLTVDLEHFSPENYFFPTAGNSLALVVDSDLDSLTLTAEIVKFCGCCALTTTNSQNALQLAIAHQPALVLLELMLPEIDGISLTMQLRQSTSCPIIAVTGLPKFLFQAKALAAGCNDFIEKPVVVESLETTIFRFLNISSSASPSE
ncbi:response regulator receiver protein [Gloeocapsa sp. PCC 7428]|uniref:response regulator n=1 Tax=Gloeocapsa sp. PCC 7428 TaxID=1173026 RepID=UPI0002A60A2A|nr:response regulator [Gloeocapsa sp. PCC 7428]AFZ32274.1 response regulator receiver protein [Gloeocapsa sp. PCC 7428]